MLKSFKPDRYRAMTKQANLKIVFDNRAIKYELSDWVTDKELLDKISLEINRFGPTNLLDLGIGTGVVESQINPSVNITGIDISRQMLKNCRKKHPRANLIQGDINQLLSLVKKRFDLIFSRATLGHMKVLPVLKMCRQILKRKGKILLCESIAYSKEDKERQLKFHNLIHPGHIEFPTKEEFEAMFSKIKMKILSSQVFYTNCSLNLLFQSLGKYPAKEERIKNYLRELSKESAKSWQICFLGSKIYYRRPWLLIAAEKQSI